MRNTTVVDEPVGAVGQQGEEQGAEHTSLWCPWAQPDGLGHFVKHRYREIFLTFIKYEHKYIIHELIKATHNDTAGFQHWGRKR